MVCHRNTLLLREKNLPQSQGHKQLLIRCEAVGLTGPCIMVALLSQPTVLTPLLQAAKVSSGSAREVIFANVLGSERLASLHPVSKNMLFWSHSFHVEKEQVVQARFFNGSVYMQSGFPRKRRTSALSLNLISRGLCSAPEFPCRKHRAPKQSHTIVSFIVLGTASGLTEFAAFGRLYVQLFGFQVL